MADFSNAGIKRDHFLQRVLEQSAALRVRSYTIGRDEDATERARTAEASATNLEGLREGLALCAWSTTKKPLEPARLAAGLRATCEQLFADGPLQGKGQVVETETGVWLSNATLDAIVRWADMQLEWRGDPERYYAIAAKDFATIFHEKLVAQQKRER